MRFHRFPVSYAYLAAENGARLIVEERGDARTSEGETVGVTFDPARAYVFEAGEGRRLR